MTNQLTPLLNQQTVEVFDARKMPFANQTISHFALTDSLMTYVGETGHIVLHIWPTSQLVILGMMDTKLPYFGEALSVFEPYGYDYIVRNSGGLGVVGDEGVLNFSLIIPDDSTERLSIDTGYDIMLELVQKALADLPGEIEAYEIERSYCPGSYDLSIRGKKIAGVSQRRIKGGLAIMIYISVNGDQQARSEMLKEFYEKGLQGETTKWSFPHIDPSVMTTLEDAYESPLSLEDIVQRLKQAVKDSGAALIEGNYTEELRNDYKKNMEKMAKRNRQMLGEYVNEEVLHDESI